MKRLNSILLSAALLLALTGCKTKPVLEEGGYYANLGTVGTEVSTGDDLARDYYNVLKDFQAWANANPSVVSDSRTLTEFKKSVDKQLTPPAEPDEPLTLYYTMRDTWVQTRSAADKQTFDAQADIIQNLITQLLVAIQ